MKFGKIEILEKDNNKKGDLFGRLMGDLFHVLGYDEPRLNIHKSGREIDLEAMHRTERKIAIAECKAHKEKIGGDDINKFFGALDIERVKHKKNKEFKKHELPGYFISLSGFNETAVEQEKEAESKRVILIKPEKIVEELIEGKIIVSIEKAISIVSSLQKNLTLVETIDLFAYEKGWIWVIYYSNSDGQKISNFTFVHAEGKPLIKEIADEIIKLDKSINKNLDGLTYLKPENESSDLTANIEEAKNKYFNYIENECGV